MLIHKKYLAVIIAVSLISGALIEYQYSSKRVIKETESNKETQENNIITIIKERKNVDGSEEKETRIVDKTKKSEEATKSVTVSEPATKNWFIYGALSNTNVYTLGVSRRIIGPIYVGGYADTSRTVGVSVGVQF